MKRNYQKTFAMALILAMALAFGAKNSQAATYSPKISSASSIKASSLVLNVVCSELKKEKVTIKVQVENTDDDSTKTKTFKTTLSKSGKASLKISDLESGDAYKFKVKIKKNSESAYSEFSDSVSASTKGTKYSPEISSIKSIKDDSLVLKITCSELKKKEVNVQVRIENKDDDDSDTKTVEATLDKNGKANIDIDSLDSGTKYGFKIKIKKTSDSSYSSYSGEKTAETED